ncbi:MAG: cobalamin-binding protein [Pseudomonadota bacterium]|nr:cobalamin-binding protein [Pseudomonadota bacterium]
MVDDAGRTVTLQEPARRIVSLAPHITENLFTAGAGARVVGAVEYSDYPPPAARIPRVGNYNRINLEAVLELEPDLVIAWRSGNPAGAAARLEKLGLAVFYSEPETFRQVIENIRKFSLLAGTEGVVGGKLERFLADYDSLRERYGSRSPVRVFYQIWDNPLTTLNGRHLISRALQACGGVNIFADLPLLAPRVNTEAVLERNPEVILFGTRAERQPGWKQAWRKWVTLDAVRHGHLNYVNPDNVNRQTVRLLAGMRSICELLDGVRSSRLIGSE